MRKDAENQLKIMRLVGGDAFKLIAYIGFYCINGVLWSLRGTFILAVLFAFLAIWHRGPTNFYLLPVVFVAGVIGRSVKLYYFLGGLLHPEETMKRLEKMAAGE